MKKRIISLFLTVLMMLSLFSAFALPTTAAGAINFVFRPSVLIGGGGEYNIVWKNNVAGIGYVTYTYNDQQYTVYDEDDGVVRTDDYYHSVRIPTDHIDNASKVEVFASSIKSRTGFDISIDDTVSQVVKVKGFDGDPKLKVACFSDLHMSHYEGYPTLQNCVKAINEFMDKDLDFIYLGGDLITFNQTEKTVDVVFGCCQDLFEASGGVPILYTKGNHECRGEYLQVLARYFHFETDESYGHFNFGPMSAYVFDSGEDKEDAHQEYGDLNAMEHYKEEEYEWFRVHPGHTADAQYKVTFSHSPSLVDVYFQSEMIQRNAKLGTQLIINGHSHGLTLNRGNANNPVPQFHDGGHNDNTTMRTSLVEFDGNTIKFKGFDPVGGVILDETLDISGSKGAAATETVSTKKSATTVKSESAVKQTASAQTVKAPTAAGVSTMSLKAAGDTTAIVIKPTVFDGGRNYNVVWQSTPGLKTSGEVEVTTNSGKLRYKDATGGKIRTDSTHGVKIPKTSFGNVTYEAKSRVVVVYSGAGYVGNPPTTYGAFVSAGKVSFTGEATAKQTKYSILAITNTDTQAHAEKVKASLGNKKPNVLVTLGNMVKSLDTEDDFKNYLRTTYTITEGKYPVIYLRGEGECTGDFASKIGRYIRNTTEEVVNSRFYLNTTFGELSIIGLDTGLESPDNTPKYNGYASMDSIRKEQVEWLGTTIPKMFTGTYNFVFSHADNLRDVCGVDLTEGLQRLGTNIVVGGTSGKSSLSVSADTYSKAIVGSPNVDKTYGMLFTCEDDKILVNVLGGNELGEIDVASSVASDKVNPDDEKPSTDDSKDDTTDSTPSNPSSPSNPSTDDTTGTPQGPTLEMGQFDGIAADTYLRSVKEGWYRDYYSVGFNTTALKPVSNGKMTESQFILVVAKLASVDLNLYEGDTDEEKAAAWAKDYGIYTGYLADNVVSDAIINTVLTSIFTAQ